MFPVSIHREANMPSEQSARDFVTVQIGGRQTRVVRAGIPGEAEQATIVRIGFMWPGAALSHTPPTELELEHAIAAVEDSVMPLATMFAAAAELATSDMLAHRLAGLGPGRTASGEMLSIDVVENLFNDMAAVALGRPSAGSPFLDSALCGYLIILREFMHHLGFTRVFVRPPA